MNTNLSDQLEKLFGTSLNVIMDGLLRSTSARGYLLGALSEILLRQELTRLGYETERIKEKWVGPKLHHGDLYVRKAQETKWFVLESKGLKSNAEKWHKVLSFPTDKDRLIKAFERKKSGEIKEWWDRLPSKRRRRIIESGSFNRAKILETHLVSGTAGKAGRKIATPRKTEFHIIGLDLFLRSGKHEFIYAATQDLPSADGHRAHLKQNYLIDILVPGVDLEPTIPTPWTRDFYKVFARLRNPVRDEDRQVDERRPGEREVGIEIFETGDALPEDVN